MTWLVACEYSGRVRDALLAIGIGAVSCDLLPPEVDVPEGGQAVVRIYEGLGA